MPINLTMNVSVPGGGQVSADTTLEVAAYDRISEEIPNDGNPIELNLQPAVAGTLQFLAIWSSAYGQGLTYRVNEPNADPLPLDRVQIFSGPPALLVEDPLHRIYVTNQETENVTVEVLLGRDAVAPAAPPAPAAGDAAPAAPAAGDAAPAAPAAGDAAPAAPAAGDAAPAAPAASEAPAGSTEAPAPAAAGTGAATPAAPAPPGPGSAAPETGAAAPEASPPGTERR
jgi:hypothetical protein